jgi:drug/metabolite transporter (DMT)-like permease
MISTPITSMLLVLFASLVGSVGMVFLKKASAHLHKGFFHIISVNAAAGVSLFLLSSVIYLKGISHGQISVLYPMVSLSYVWTLFWSKLVFHEPFTRQKFLGLGLVLTGAIFVGLGS